MTVCFVDSESESIRVNVSAPLETVELVWGGVVVAFIRFDEILVCLDWEDELVLFTRTCSAIRD